MTFIGNIRLGEGKKSPCDPPLLQQVLPLAADQEPLTS